MNSQELSDIELVDIYNDTLPLYERVKAIKRHRQRQERKFKGTIYGMQLSSFALWYIRSSIKRQADVYC